MALQVGDKLGNGATVVMAAPDPSSRGEEFVVLAMWNREFVTWITGPDGQNSYWGHYFDSTELAAALEDFKLRSK